MGMYTELNLRFALKKNTPYYVITMIERVMAEYPTHIYTGKRWAEYYECERCGHGLTEWLGSDPIFDMNELERHCKIIGEYSPDGCVLLRVHAESDWLRTHWEELTVKFGVE